MEMHDDIVFMLGFFVVVMTRGVRGVQVKKWGGEEPEQNRQANLGRYRAPHDDIVDDRSRLGQEFSGN